MQPARGARERSVPVVRLAKPLGLVATTSVATALLGLRAMGIWNHQSEHPRYSSQLKTRCPLLLKYDVILLIISHHLLWRGYTLPSLVAPISIICFIFTQRLLHPEPDFSAIRCKQWLTGLIELLGFRVHFF